MNHDEAGKQGFGFNPFGYAFSAFSRGGGPKKDADEKTFEEILKDFEEFFNMAENVDDRMESGSTKGVIKGRDI